MSMLLLSIVNNRKQQETSCLYPAQCIANMNEPYATVRPCRVKAFKIDKY